MSREWLASLVNSDAVRTWFHLCCRGIVLPTGPGEQGVGVSILQVGHHLNRGGKPAHQGTRCLVGKSDGVV